MKEIIKVTADDKSIRIIIDGDNTDLLTAVTDILKKIETESNITTDTSLRVIKKMLEE